MPSTDPQSHPFLVGGGPIAARIAAFDWGATSLGPIAQWPAHVKHATSLMLQSVVPIVMLWGEHGVMIYNDAYAVFAGLRHPRLLGSKVREGWPEVADFNDHVMRTGLAGDTLHYQDQELTLHRHDRAEQVWMNLDYSPLRDDEGRPAGVMAIVVETTEKVLAQRRLDSENARLAQLFEQAPSFMAMLSGPGHRFELANPGYLRLVGHRDILGKTVAEALPDAAQQGYVALLDDVFRTGEAYSATDARYDLQTVPGGPIDRRLVDFVFQPMRDVRGVVTGIFIEGIDVTERRQAEAALREQSARREAIAQLHDAFGGLGDPSAIALAAARMLGGFLHASRVGYGAIDAACVITIRDEWNTAGVPMGERLVRVDDFSALLGPMRHGEVVAVRDVATDPVAIAYLPIFQDLQVRAFVNVPVLEGGRLVAALYVNDDRPRDWTTAEIEFLREVAARTHAAVERARTARELREANELLEARVQARTRELMQTQEALRQSQKMEAVGQLTGGIAHDFNNLLAAISGSLQVARLKLARGKTEDLSRYFDIGEQSIRRAASLTQRLLAFSRRQTLDPKATDANRLVSSMEELIRRTVGPSVEVVVVEAVGLWPTLVDPSQLENALLNLCINARDAMLPAGGRLIIETANKWIDERAARERDLAPGQYISLCVTDTGTGMTPAVIARIFDPFFTTKPLGEGTGLGLSMVYGFVRQSGGQVRVYSEVGVGTTMCLYLPRHAGTADADAQSAEPAIESGDGETVLVIEDERAIRDIVEEVLGAAGYRILTANDGPTGLQLLNSDTRIDLLVTDVGLPGGLNGRQVADAARVHRPDLKVLFITGYADNAAVGNGRLEPGMEVMTKPFEIAALANKVSDLIRRRGSIG